MVSGTVDFEPTTVAFVRNWCMYAGADVAGTSGIPYQTNARIMRLMCSGAVDPVFVLKSVVDGADDVLIGGCHPGDCLCQDGNFEARSRGETLKEILRHVGLEADQVWLRWIAASEVERLKRGPR
jgi:F420-non-reducing hydrogenase iron-sulfur subunit